MIGPLEIVIILRRFHCHRMSAEAACANKVLSKKPKTTSVTIPQNFHRTVPDRTVVPDPKFPAR